MSNSLDQDQARHNVGPDLDPYCLQRLSVDDISRHDSIFSVFSDSAVRSTDTGGEDISSMGVWGSDVQIDALSSR